MTWNGNALRAIRKAQAMGLRTLASKTGLDRGYLGRLERGEIRRPARHRVQRIADALDVPAAALNPTDEETT